MKDETNRQSNILFVCYGNICRSPIAEYLARKMELTSGVIDSAGTHASFASPTEEAIAVMRDEYAVDISGHRPKRVATVALPMFDHIVALNTDIADSLKADYPNQADKVIDWGVEDPYLLGAQTYRRCARVISRRLNEFSERLQ